MTATQCQNHQVSLSRDNIVQLDYIGNSPREFRQIGTALWLSHFMAITTITKITVIMAITIIIVSLNDYAEIGGWE